MQHWACEYRGACSLKRTYAAYGSRQLHVRNPVSAWIVVSYVSSVLCRYRPMRCADHSFRGVLPSVCVCVWPINLKRRLSRPELGHWATNTEQSVGSYPHPSYQSTTVSQVPLSVSFCTHPFCKQTLHYTV